MNAWQVLDVGSIWMKEFASALAEMEPVVAWLPKIENAGAFLTWERTRRSENPPLEMREFPLQRGYARFPIRSFVPYETGMIKRMVAQTQSPEQSPLICSTPFYAPVAERWPGPIIYYVTDLTAAYDGLNADQVRALDVRMCKAARVVCPNSRRIAKYLIEKAECEGHKITVVPNATRESNVADRPREEPGPLPTDVIDLTRPIVGVLGDLSGNMDWELIAEVVQRTQELSWLFVGPADRQIADAQQRGAREWVKANARFVGMKPYGELQQYARCVDAAVLPYRKKEPTYSGSSTRFYEHLAAGRPMVATRGFAELLEKEPLLALADNAEEMIHALRKLRAAGFRDGHEAARWEASKKGTWQERARAMRHALLLSDSQSASASEYRGPEPVRLS
ncbi:glycosyltransferase involved in cell wall biosynthesis [Silvibacterium bohemicum]|uniref:Glycosyltransferase involved in cell wall biosynthesis n=2 Tax=Silvibacterium bohemicum TaxID=1577686 RepID=A0A841JXG4_9BACT|nr:glycosyltransferase [Silvibacterium bohemicum]MBB6143681.1 glycosyltransferase involved in cell wall biosynthesis [Silvibacterium bohemicum]